MVRDKRTDTGLDGRTDGRTDGWTDGRKKGITIGLSFIFIHHFIFIHCLHCNLTLIRPYLPNQNTEHIYINIKRDL